MPLELRPGVVVPIPCRHCQKSLIRFTVAEGVTSIACGRCRGSTEVQVYMESGTLRIRTAPIQLKPPKTSGN